MNSFLHDVARSLHHTYGDRLAQMSVVFASRRAIRYFARELELIGAVKPKCYSMDSWIVQLIDDVEVESKFVLCAKLFEIYSKYHPDESFDQFYSFGSLLLSDFDMIDRYMVDARALYSIVSDTRDVESGEEDTLRDAAIEFWSRFDASSAERQKQQEFLRVWHSLYDIYSDYNELLDQQHITYSGRIYRHAAENFDAEQYGSRIVFVGLNALSKSEQVILSKLKDNDLADFIWDYDPSWLDDQTSECGYFISHNLNEFEQADYFTTLIQEKKDVSIRVVESPSDAAQCKLLPRLLNEISMQVGELDDRVGVILTDEKLLLPLLYSLPPAVRDLNISMGYPLRATLAYRFVEILIRLQQRIRGGKFYAADVSSLLSHPYLTHTMSVEFDKTYLSVSDLPTDLSPFWKLANGNYHLLHKYLADCVELIITQVEDARELQFLQKTMDSISMVGAMIMQSEHQLSVSLYLSLLVETIDQQSIEFEGVSGRGLQIIGILESRTLDFEHIIVLSMNDDNFPSSRPDSSYIPQLLLQGYGMPTIAEKSAIWSYYFYRLLQRSKGVNLLYCNVSDGMTTGEQSRYISQLEYCSSYHIERVQVSINEAPIAADNSIAVDKTPQTIERIKALRYYPTMFSAYRTCPLSFYFSSIESIAKWLADDEQITAADTGNILHKTIYQLYVGFCGKGKVCSLIGAITEDEISSTIDSVMLDVLGEKIDNEPSMASIVRMATQRMVRSIINYDLKCDDLFSIECLEKKISGKIAGFDFAGVIDRVDRLRDGSVRIIDYKTGSVQNNIESIQQLFDENDEARGNSIVLQMLIYSILAYKHWRVDVSAQIYAVRKMSNNDTDFSPSIFISKEEITVFNPTHYQLIEQSIEGVFTRMCDTTQPFVQTPDVKSCQYCNFASICCRAALRNS